MVGAVQALLRPSRAVVVPADLRAGRVQRQRAEVDAADAGACHRVRSLSSLSTLHHARAVGCGAGLAPPACCAPGTARRLHPRHHERKRTDSVALLLEDRRRR